MDDERTVADINNCADYMLVVADMFTDIADIIYGLAYDANDAASMVQQGQLDEAERILRDIVYGAGPIVDLNRKPGYMVEDAVDAVTDKLGTAIMDLDLFSDTL